MPCSAGMLLHLLSRSSLGPFTLAGGVGQRAPCFRGRLQGNSKRQIPSTFAHGRRRCCSYTSVSLVYGTETNIRTNIHFGLVRQLEATATRRPDTAGETRNTALLQRESTKRHRGGPGLLVLRGAYSFRIRCGSARRLRTNTPSAREDGGKEAETGTHIHDGIKMKDLALLLDREGNIQLSVQQRLACHSRRKDMAHGGHKGRSSNR